MMAGRGDPRGDAAGGPARHLPVLLERVVAMLAPRDGGIYIDGTFGGGGYARALLDAADCRVLGIDRDPEAIAAGSPLHEASGDRLTLVEGRFGSLDRIAGEAGFTEANGVALDIGVSTMQLDSAARGFSFSHDGPLDMRMGGDGPSAADVVNTFAEADLANIVRGLGEERRARAVAGAIVAARARAPIATTRRLADIVAATVPRARDGIHPATRTFQALRVYVNSELDELAEGLGAAERVLAPGGRLAVVAFHSLEDRIVKRFLAERSARGAGTSRHLPEPPTEAPSFTLLVRRPVVPDEAEVAANPRARSARLRGAERTGAHARPLDAGALDAPRLPALPAVSGRPR